jgi:hypothetical protein
VSLPRHAAAGVALLGVIVGTSPVAAQAPPAGDPLTVSVVTMGPGDHPFLKFGHDAIWIRDAEARTDKVYNFGTFRFDSPRLIVDFLKGRLSYWLSVSSLRSMLAEYQHENRDISVQELRLAPEAKKLLQARLDENARPENRAYKYDYFLDNCSTRVRDALEPVLGTPAFRDVARAPARMTLRQHALRMTADPLWFYVALDMVLGPEVDRPIDRWTEMFLPAELARGLDATPDLVVSSRELFKAKRQPPREAPPAWAKWFLLAGVLVGLGFLALGWGGSRTAWARVPFGALLAVWGLLVGFIGCFFVYAWVFTDHVVAHRNQNILLCAPWAIALVVFGVGVAMGRHGAIRKALVVAGLASVATVLACLLHLGIGRSQANGTLIAYFLPAWAGVAGALAVLRRATAPGTSTP